MSLRGTGAGEGPLKPLALPGGPSAIWYIEQLGLSVEIALEAHGSNPWSISARSEHLQPKHGANESAYDSARERTAKE